MKPIPTIEKTALRLSALAGIVVGAATTTLSYLMFKKGETDFYNDIHRSGMSVVNEDGDEVYWKH